MEVDPISVSPSDIVLAVSDTFIDNTILTPPRPTSIDNTVVTWK